MQGAYQVDNILKHGVNNFFILLDIFLSKQPFVSYHFQVGCLICQNFKAYHTRMQYAPPHLKELAESRASGLTR